MSTANIVIPLNVALPVWGVFRGDRNLLESVGVSAAAAADRAATYTDRSDLFLARICDNCTGIGCDDCNDQGWV